jgi:UDPglucose--hexose-1-phosphate uridylyltransferase
VPELRRDIVTGKWVVIATERAKRPESFTQATKEEVKPSDTCPFCYGNEHLTPPEVMAYRPDGSPPDTTGWTLRVVPNKFPAFTLEEKVVDSGDGFYESQTGLGVHEVIVHSPDHKKSFALLSPEEAADVVRAYRDRYASLRNDERLRYILFIVNQGKMAGASLEHPHSQLFAVPLIPTTIREEIVGSARYFREKEGCVYCELIRYESTAEKRIVAETENFVSFAPYASRVPFETWILPKKHQARFESMTEPEIDEFAQLLRDVLARLYFGLGDPAYNYFIHTSPCRDPELKVGEFGKVYHWHLEIMPKLSIMAGFELGLGIMINVSNPEETADFLRNVEVRTG